VRPVVFCGQPGLVKEHPGLFIRQGKQPGQHIAVARRLRANGRLDDRILVVRRIQGSVLKS
jgi:hypothetical protein